MASDNETIAEIVEEIRTIPWKVYNQEIEGDDDCGISQSYCNVLAERVEAAQKREVAALNELIDDNLRVHKAAERADADTKLELNGEIVRRDIVIAELRECLKEAFREYCNGTKPCSSCWAHQFCRFEKWRKALEGANYEDR